MIYELLFQSEALSEMTEAFEWYEEQKEGLGYEFLEEIEACCKKLTDNPQRFSYINDLYRRIKTDRFPYLLIYEIEYNNVIIYSLRHIKRKPL